MGTARTRVRPVPAALPGVLLVAGSVLGASVLAGCTPDAASGGPEAIEVTGEFGQRPTVVFDVPFAVGEPSATVLIDGDGPGLQDGAPILVDWIAFDGSTGDVRADTYQDVPGIFAFTQESLGEELYDGVSAAGMNDRVLYLEPATGDSGLPAANVVVLDVQPARAQGEPVQPQPGLPGVTLAEDGSPTVSVPAAPAPAARVEQVLIKGDGAQVAADSTIIVQYHVVRWHDGSVQATTWGEDRLPERLDLATTFPGLSAGLVDQTAMSQVLLVVPPEEAEGTDTLVIVVDILAVEPASAPAEPTPGPSPSVSSPAPAEPTAGPEQASAASAG